MGSNHGWNAEDIFQKYLHDYFVKKNMHKTAEVFAKEANADVSSVVSAADSPQGFLAEWWSIFHDVFFSMQSQNVEVTEKVDHVTGTTSQYPCSGTPNYGIAPQSNMQFSVGNDCDHMSMQLSPITCEGPNYKRMTGKVDTSSQTSTETQSSSKLAGSTPSNPQRNTRKQAQQRQDKKRVTGGGSKPLSLSTSAEPPPIGSDTILDSSPLKGWPLLGPNQVAPRLGHQVLNSYIQSMSNHPQIDMSLSQSQHEILTQLVASAPVKPLSSFPLTSDSDMLFRNRRDGTIGQDGRDEEYRGMDEGIETFFSQYDDNADCTNARCSLQHSSALHERHGHTSISLEEVGSLHASKGKLFSCNFSHDGKLLACAGQDKKVVIWNIDSSCYSSSLETHAQIITDVRFHPSSEYFATSSFDQTVKIWDAAEPGKSLFALAGHVDHVMSLDFHPRKMDLLCSCDSNDELRLWNIKELTCLRVYKGATRQVRFQPQLGTLLATASGNGVNIFNIETGDIEFDLKGHQSEVHSICWDVTGKYIASVSEESVRLWSIFSGGRCICELHSKGNNFQSCTFHPAYPLLLIVGSCQFIGLWNPTQSSTVETVQAHSEFIASLASSPSAGLIASASHDQIVKLWR